MQPWYAGIEAGGTKFVCAVGTGPDDLCEETRIDTGAPEATLREVTEWLRAQRRKRPITAAGLACFGPVDLNPASTAYGHVTVSPKVTWCHTDVLGPVREAAGVPVGFDTDVNGAALGEMTWGAAKGLDTCVYLTVGTGIGGGVVAGGRSVQGLVHPEVGHMRIPHDRARDPFGGCCPYHGDCLEGLASGTAMRERWGRPGAELSADHPAWALEAHYLALGLQNLMVTVSPQRAVLGGGVSQAPGLHAMIQAELVELLGGYVTHPQVEAGLKDWVVPPALGQRAGVLGAIELARRAAAEAAQA